MARFSFNRILARQVSQFVANSTVENDVITVASSGGAGSSVYATTADLPLVGNTTGDQAFVSGNNRLYIWNGSGWYNIALINNAPTITQGGEGVYRLAADGTSTVISLAANDSEDLPIIWSYVITSGTLGNTATISQDSSVFTITPSTNEADEGVFSITFTASDGVNTSTDVNQFTLSFLNFDNAVYFYDFGDANSYPGTGTTVTDLTGNNFNATLVGSPTINSGYITLDGSNDELKMNSGSDAAYPDNPATWFFSINVPSAQLNSNGGAYILDYDGGGSAVASNRTGLDVQALSDGSIRFNIVIGTTSYAYSSTTGVFGADTWHTIAITRDTDGTINFYIDGVFINTVAGITGTRRYDGEYSEGKYAYGYYGNSLYTQDRRWENFSIAAVGVWNRVITPSEVTYLHNVYSLA